MKKFYKTKNGNYVAVEGPKTEYFNENFVLKVGEDGQWVEENLARLSLEEEKQAEELLANVDKYKLVDSKDGIDFFLNQDDFKIYAKMSPTATELVGLDSPAHKEVVLEEKKKIKDFLKGIRKSKESFKFGDRVLLYGPTGTGKTYSFVEFLKVAKIPFSIVPVSEGMEDIDFFQKIIPTEKGVSYVQKDICNLLAQAEKDKVCIIFDELNRGSKSFMNLVLKALDAVDGKFYYLTDVIADHTYKIPIENIIWGATINLGGKYTGTNALDEALFDRFNIVNYKGYNKEVEKSIIKEVIKDKDLAKKVYEFVEEIRDLHSEGEIRSPISTRGIKAWLEEMLNIGDLLEAFERTLLYRLVNVDNYGIPNSEQVDTIKSAFKDKLS